MHNDPTRPFYELLRNVIKMIIRLTLNLRIVILDEFELPNSRSLASASGLNVN